MRLYARALRGQRARGTRPHKRGKNVSMIGAISLKGIVASINLLGSTDQLTFEAFVIRKLVPNLWKGATVVWDNCSIHKGKEIEKAIVETGASLVYLPPYSPDFNPIENFWSKVKNTLRSIGARTYQALDLKNKKVLIYRDGVFRGNEIKNLLDWGKAINSEFILKVFIQEN